MKEELVRATEAATKWETERARLNSEIERVTQSEAAAKADAQKAIEAAKTAAAATAATATAGKMSPANQAALMKEIERVGGLVKQVSALIEDPATDLSTVIRKNVERSELEAYLKGIRFAVDQK